MTEVASAVPAAPYVDPVRRAAVRRRALRDRTVASTSTVVVLVVLAVLVVSLPGWPAVHKDFFSAEHFSASFPDVLRGFWLNVRIFLVAEPLVLVFGLAIALMRSLRAPLFLPVRIMAATYVDVFRGVPTLLLVFVCGFGIPALQIKGMTSDPVILGTLALVLNYSAYVAEVYRAGLYSVHPSQSAAARSLGLGPWQTYRHVVIPQAVRNVLPPLLNDFVALQKDTALVAVLGPIEALRAAQIYADYHFNYTSYTVAALLFLSLTIPLSRLTDWLLRRQAQRQLATNVR